MLARPGPPALRTCPLPLLLSFPSPVSGPNLRPSLAFSPMAAVVFRIYLHMHLLGLGRKPESPGVCAPPPTLFWSPWLFPQRIPGLCSVIGTVFTPWWRGLSSACGGHITGGTVPATLQPVSRSGRVTTMTVEP